MLILIILAVVWLVILRLDFSRLEPPSLGVTFSPSQAQWLGLDWRVVYQDILDNLQVKNLRLIAAWNQVERQAGQYDFSDLDWQVQEAAKRQARVLMVVGRRAPRWPECHIPDWAKDLSEPSQQEKILKFLEVTVNHLKNFDNIIIWQIDNEPFVKWFGHCPLPDPDFVAREIKLVRELDKRPILITDSGELSSWRKAAKAGDLFGTTLYRLVWNPRLGYWGYKYLLPPAFYRAKAWLNGLEADQVIISELQAEAWLPRGDQKTPLSEQRRSMNPDLLRANVDFARRTGFAPAYLWGAEYWYWLKGQGDETLLQAAREIFVKE